MRKYLNRVNFNGYCLSIIYMDTFEQRRMDLIARVKRVLVNAGVPETGWAKALSLAIGVAVAQAYRKLSGASVFTLPQIEAIELAYGVELLTVPLDSGPAPIKTVRNWANAMFLVAGHELPCQVVLGSARKAVGHRFAAFLLRGKWFVCLPEEYSGTDPLFDVDLMRMPTKG